MDRDVTMKWTSPAETTSFPQDLWNHLWASSVLGVQTWIAVLPRWIKFMFGKFWGWIPYDWLDIADGLMDIADGLMDDPVTGDEWCNINLTIIKTLTPGRFEWKFRKVIFKVTLVIDGWRIIFSCEIAHR